LIDNDDDGNCVGMRTDGDAVRTENGQLRRVWYQRWTVWRLVDTHTGHRDTTVVVVAVLVVVVVVVVIVVVVVLVSEVVYRTPGCRRVLNELPSLVS